MILIEVPGKPIAQPRHKCSGRGGFTRVYIPKKHPIHEWKEKIRIAAEWRTGDWTDSFLFKKIMKPHGVRVDIVFYFKRPKGIPKSQKHHTVKPDKDNLEKAVLDALEGIIYENDSQVYTGTPTKCYSPDGREYVKIYIEES